MRVDLRTENINNVTRAALNLPGIFARARRSALSSTGWMLQQEIRNWIEYGNSWPKLHPLTLAFRKKKGRSMGWAKRRKSHPGTLSWLGKFSRYRVDPEGSAVQVDFGRGKRGRPGTFDPLLSRVAREAQGGKRIPVTDSMRAFVATTKRGKRVDHIPGRTFFPLRRSTTHLNVPPRPIFGPVFARKRSMIGPHFEKKFWDAIKRYKKEELRRGFRSAARGIFK